MKSAAHGVMDLGNEPSGHGSVVSLTILGDKESFVFDATPELAETLDLAALVAQRRQENFHYTFQALLLALTFGRHRISEWQRGYVVEAGIDLAEPLKYGAFASYEQASLELSRTRVSDDRELYVDGRRSASTSVLNWLRAAQRYASEQGHASVGMRHVMGALIFERPFHADDLTRWGFDRPAWAFAYLSYVALDLGPSDLEFWQKVDRRVYDERREAPRKSLSTRSSSVHGGSPTGPSGVAPVEPRSVLPPPVAFDPSTASPETLPGIENDSIDGEPYIDITADVRSIARVMCMQDVKPPLSIALFGNWGSGKSFFMRQLQKEVERIKTREKKAVAGLEPKAADQQGSSFYQHIIQIEFNAWHYVEANLWASLVYHLFENLRGSGNVVAAAERETERQRKAEVERDTLLAQLGTVTQARLEAERALENARANEASAREALRIKQNEAQDKAVALRRVNVLDVLAQTEVPEELRESFDKASKLLGLSEAVHSAKEVASALADARRFERGTSAFLRAFWIAPGFGKRVALIGVAIVAPLVVAFLISHIPRLAQSPGWATATKVFTAVVAFFGLLADPLRSTKKYAEEAVNALKSANQKLESATSKAQQCLDEEKQRAEGAHAQANSALKTAEKAAADADAAVQKAKQALAAASPIRILNSFIEERSASDDYRKSLGTMALVRRDFDKLSQLMTRARAFRAKKKDGEKAELSDEEKELQKLPEIDRIILYIDDLDRCPPRQVVEVLQAIHLLLAFELFVVVVGVDPRWVSRSLKKHYPELLSDDLAREETDADNGKRNAGAASDPVADVARPLDYLEKIFQIPFWIKPIGARETSALLQGLLVPKEPTAPRPDAQGVSVGSAGAGSASGPPSESPAPSQAARSTGDARSADDARSVDGASPDGEAGSPPALPLDSGSAKPGLTLPETHPLSDPELHVFAGTVLIDDEVKFLTGLERAAGTSPRAVKRYVNIYRLLRARVSKQSLLAFQGESGSPREFEAVMHLLAMFNTAPSLAQRFCRMLEHCESAERDELRRQDPGSSARASDTLQTPLESVFKQIEDAAYQPTTGAEKRLWSTVRLYATNSTFKTAATIDAYCRWYRVISRYSFSGGAPS
jgi:hypothetical protein